MREQIRLWFYSQLFMSVVLTGRAPFRAVLGYEKMLDETGREMHGSWGNTITAEDAFARMGADVMRWQYCAQPPDRNLLFGFGPGGGDQARAAHALELGQVLRRLREHRGVPAVVGRARASTASCEPLDRWLVERTHALRRRGERRVRGVPHRRRHARVRGVRRRSLELVHPPLAPRFWDGDDLAPFQTLWYALVQTLRVIAPIMPFLDRPPVAAPRPRRARVGAPRRLAGGRRARSRRCSTRSPRCGASSSSAARRARRRGSSCASRCAGSSSRARAVDAARGRDRRRAAREGGRASAPVEAPSCA